MSVAPTPEDERPRARVTIDYRSSAVPKELKEALQRFDVNGDGLVNTQDLIGASNAQEQLKKQNTFLKTITAVLVVLLCVFAAVSFALTLQAIEMSKESRISGGLMTDKGTGETVQVASADMAVVDGKLVARASGRRLADSSSLVTCAGGKPRVSSLKYARRRLDAADSELRNASADYSDLTISASAVMEALGHYGAMGVSDFVVDWPTGSGGAFAGVRIWVG